MQITKVQCPASKYDIKCPYPMTPTRVVVHNTANDASAMSEISYMLGNSNECSFHYAVDDQRAVQGIDETRNTWNAGDGNGRGNREGISVEICYSKSGGPRFTAAEQNGAKLVALILKRYGWGMERVTKHQDYSGKYCPHRTLDLGWQRFLNMVKAELGNYSNAPAKSDTCGPFTVPQGKTYQFKITTTGVPTLVCGSPCFTLLQQHCQGNDHFFVFRAIGKVGDGCGFYLNGAKAPVAVATIR